VRQILSRLSTEQSQGLSATTEAVYLKEAKQINWKPSSVDLGDGAKGHWIGPSDAHHVMLYFHGGGYIGYATPGHLKYQFELQAAAKEHGHSRSLAIFSVSYTLAPEKIYPHQLLQATLALRYLLEVERRDPSSVSFPSYTF
jgi:acetyl esterase/lipase